MARGTKERRPSVSAASVDVVSELAALEVMGVDELRKRWRVAMGSTAPAGFSKDLIARTLAYRLQEQQLGGLSSRHRQLLAAAARPGGAPIGHLKVGSVIVREYGGVLYEVVVAPDGFCWNGQTHASLSTIARRITGTRWNGPRFFGLRSRDDHEAQDDNRTQVRTDGPHNSVRCPGTTAGGTQLNGRKQSATLVTGAAR